jgi:hypothetical protein
VQLRLGQGHLIHLHHHNQETQLSDTQMDTKRHAVSFNFLYRNINIINLYFEYIYMVLLILYMIMHRTACVSTTNTIVSPPLVYRPHSPLYCHHLLYAQFHPTIYIWHNVPRVCRRQRRWYHSPLYTAPTRPCTASARPRPSTSSSRPHDAPPAQSTESTPSFLSFFFLKVYKRSSG